MTTGGITRLLLTVRVSEKEAARRGAVAARLPTMRTTPVVVGYGGPVNGLPRVRPYVWPSNRYTRTYTLALSVSAGRRAEGGSINNSLAEPSISPRRYDPAVDRPRDYIRLRS